MLFPPFYFEQFCKNISKGQKLLLWGKGLSECYSHLSMSEQFCKNISKASKGFIMG